MTRQQRFDAPTGPSDCARGMAQSIEESFMKITEPQSKSDQRVPPSWPLGEFLDGRTCIQDPPKTWAPKLPTHIFWGDMLNCEFSKNRKETDSELSAKWNETCQMVKIQPHYGTMGLWTMDRPGLLPTSRPPEKQHTTCRSFSLANVFPTTKVALFSCA